MLPGGDFVVSHFDVNPQGFQGDEKIISAVWNVGLEQSDALFEPRQFVEMPFYNQALFDELARIEFLIHLMPAGRLQLEGLEAAG